jgi:uncharacterized repeat protein (TIGR04138 family)
VINDRSAIVENDLHDIVLTDPRYPIEAYEFICDSVCFTQELLGRDPQEEDDPNTDYHICGEELARGACELALQEFGLMAGVVFRTWNIHRTDDIGEIVFNLIKAKKLSQGEEDSVEDFHELFDLNKILTDDFALTVGSEQTKGNE